MVGSCAGTFYALDRATGDVRWSYDIRPDGPQTSFHGDPVVDGSRIFFDTDFSCTPNGIGHIYAADVKSGHLLWKYRSTSGISTNLLKIGSKLCFGEVGGAFGCLDALTGKLQWQMKPEVRSDSCELPKWMTTDRHRLFLVDRDGKLAAVDVSTGMLSWRANLPSPVSTSPVLVDGTLFVGARGGVIYAVSPGTGKLLASIPVAGEIRGRPAAADGAVYFLAETPDGNHGLLISVQAAARKVSWVHEHPRSIATDQPSPWNGLVIVGDCVGNLTAVNKEDGSTVWSIPLKGCLRSVGVSPTALYVGAQEGAVCALRVD